MPNGILYPLIEKYFNILELEDNIFIIAARFIKAAITGIILIIFFEKTEINGIKNAKNNGINIIITG